MENSVDIFFCVYLDDKILFVDMCDDCFPEDSERESWFGFLDCHDILC
jgi:hypothetical protein